MDFEAGMDNLERMLHDARAEPTDLPLSVLKKITDNFSNDQEVGRGGFAIVYKGRLRNGIVAVKKLHQTLEMQEKKYNQEVALLMRVKHKNIVRFLGYCADTQGKICHHEGEVVMADIRHRLLCFEFLPNGSLDGYITGANQKLEWSTRYKLIKGICEGLNYLHHKNIAHLDLKPANILLDDNMVPKIADFGLSRCFGEGQSQTIASKLVGSQGYLAPEFYDKVITLKLDIYSLGVIIIEILTGKKGHFRIENVLESWSNVLKPSQAGTLLEQVRVCSEIALECTDRNPENRPTTKCVTERLREMETRCSSIETDFVYTSPVTHCTDPNLERREITLRLDKIECTHGFIGSDLGTSSAMHEKKVSTTESQNPTPKQRHSPVLDVHPRPLEPKKIHGLYESSTDVEQENVRLSGDAKFQIKDAGAKDRRPMDIPLGGGGGGDKKGGKGDNNEVVKEQIKGNGNNGGKRAFTTKQNNGGGVENTKGIVQSSGAAGPPVVAGGLLEGKTRPYIIGEGDVGFPGMDQIGGWPMSMPMDHPRIGKVQQGGGAAARGMPAGATPTAGFQERGTAGGSSMPSEKQMLRPAVVAGSPMARPQYIAPMQNHGGGDGHVNYGGGGKIKGDEQPQNTKCVAPGGGGGGAGGIPVSIGGALPGGMTPPKNTMIKSSNMVGDASFPGIGQMSGGPMMTMGIPMNHLHIGNMQQSGGGGSATQGMPAGGRIRNTPSGLPQATMAAGQQQQGMPSGTEVLQDAAAARDPKAQQQYMAAVVAGSPMARPQYITPKNHGGGDDHMNYGGGKIGGEQPQNTKQFIVASGNGGVGDLPVSVSSPLPGGMTPAKNVMMRSNMIGDPSFPGIGQKSGGPTTMGVPMDHLHIPSMQQGGGCGGATQGMPAGDWNTPSGLVRAAVAAGNPMAQQQRGMPSGREVLEDAAAAGNPRAHQQYMDRMQQQSLLVARGIKKKMH